MKFLVKNPLIWIVGLLIPIIFVGFMTTNPDNIGQAVEEVTFTQPVTEDPDLNATKWAEIDNKGEVVRVIVADYDFIQSGVVGNPDDWVATYQDGSSRGNYAGKGYKYDQNIDKFIPPKPYERWRLNSSTAQWHAPLNTPKQSLKSSESYVWDESQNRWNILEYVKVGDTDSRIIKQIP